MEDDASNGRAHLRAHRCCQLKPSVIVHGVGIKARVSAVEAHAAAIRGVGLRVTQPRVAVLAVLSKASAPRIAATGRLPRAVRERSVEVTLRGLRDRCS